MAVKTPLPFLPALLIALAAYGLLLLGSNALLAHVEMALPWRGAVALSPMLACAATAWVILRQLRRMDELQMRIQLEALGFAFAGTALLTFSYGFLEGLDYPRLSMFAVWPLMSGLWVLGLVLASKRYR